MTVPVQAGVRTPSVVTHRQQWLKVWLKVGVQGEWRLILAVLNQEQ